MHRWQLSTLALLMALAAPERPAAGTTGVTSDSAPGGFEAAFARLVSLVGTWDEAEDGRVVTYHLTANGSALVEEFAGEPPMATVYHMDGEDLLLTHYCNAGNQPRMRAVSYAPGAAELRFDFVDVTNLIAPEAYHTRQLVVRFVDDEHVDLTFTGLKNGEELAGTVSLTRRAEPEPVPADPDPKREGPVVDAEAVFGRMKQSLTGEWRGRLVEIDSPVEATFYSTGNGSALVEDIRRPDRPASRMHTVYHLADRELRLTHYCSFRNQPRLVATSVRDGGRTIEFELVDVTNLSRSGDRYTHRMVVSFPEEDRATITYVGVDGGSEGSLTAQLQRVR